MDRFRLAALLALVLTACTGEAGDPCQEQDDCNSGLVCCKDTMVVSARGTCEAMCTATPRRDAGTTDSGPPTDAGTDDAGADAGLEDAGSDAGPADAGTDAAADTDAGADAGPADAGTDAGADAGADAG